MSQVLVDMGSDDSESMGMVSRQYCQAYYSVSFLVIGLWYLICRETQPRDTEYEAMFIVSGKSLIT